MTTYEIFTGELVEVIADSRHEAMDKLANGEYEAIETISDFRAESCYCDNPKGLGWHVVDDPGITFGGLKRAQNEAAQDILAMVLNNYWSHGEDTLLKVQGLLDEALANNTVIEWVAREQCEWMNGTTPCDKCETRIPTDIYDEELGMCLECHTAYFNHDDEESN